MPERYLFVLYWKNDEAAEFIASAEDAERIARELRMGWGGDDCSTFFGEAGDITLSYQETSDPHDRITKLPRIDFNNCVERIAKKRHDLLDPHIGRDFREEMQWFKRKLAPLLLVINREPVTAEELREDFPCTD